MRRRLLEAIAIALLFVWVLPPQVEGATEYEMVTTAAYTVDPVAGEIAVSVAVTFTNTLPDPPGQTSAFTHVDLGLQDGASAVTASDASGGLHVDLKMQDGVQVASVKTRSRVRYNKSVNFTLVYSLTDGAAPDLHVRRRVVKFPAWGFGTTSQVTVGVPVGYETRADGDPMLTGQQGDGGVLLSSGPIADPASWFAIVTAVLPGDYATRSASVALASGTVDLQVRSWSDDPVWGEETLALLAAALPQLEEAIGLPYPRLGPLVVSEAAVGEPSGGGLPSATAEIDAAFDGSAFTLLHQTAHVWVGDKLAADRWIREGLASHYAAQVAAGLGVPPPFDPVERAEALAADARPLLDWHVADASGVADAFGYAASWALFDRIGSLVGEPHLRTALERVAGGLSAYDPGEPDAAGGDGRPQPPVDTRRLLDQLDVAVGADVSDLFSEAVFGPDATIELEQRTMARGLYRRLLMEAGDWGAPDPVRAAMSEWRFAEAAAAISATSAWLKERDALLETCAVAGLVPPNRLRERYVAAGGGAVAVAELDAEGALVDAYVAVQQRAAAQRGVLDAVGLLLADDPEQLLAHAAANFAGGDLRAAAGVLDRLELALNRAPTDGAVRLAGAAVLVALLGLAVGVTFRRRSGSHYTAAT
ncbi:MAG: hypothetical protein ABI864_00300 [Chloroflexota bacterium]